MHSFEANMASFSAAAITVFTAMGILLIVITRCIRSYNDLKETISRFIRNTKHIRRITKRIKKLVIYNKHDFTLQMVFEVFSDFYESNFFKETDWELDSKGFPDGKNELTRKYLWITKTRGENFKIVEELSFDLLNGKVLLYGHLYPSFNYSVDRHGRIYIMPVLEEESKEPLTFAKYKVKVENLHELLNTMDEENAMWILHNRKYFAI